MQTKFDIHDRIWFYDPDELEVQQGRVKEIAASKRGVTYMLILSTSVWDEHDSKHIPEQNCFATEAEAYAVLQSKIDEAASKYPTLEALLTELFKEYNISDKLQRHAIQLQIRKLTDLDIEDTAERWK